MALWEDGRIWTALVVRRRQGRIDPVAGPETLAGWTGETGGPDGFTPLALSAAWTEKVRLGTGIVG